jgi:hypothetical protein
MHGSGRAAPPHRPLGTDGAGDAEAAAAFLSSGQSGPGPEVTAGYDGECSGCWEPIYEGDPIRADGGGGWIHSECADD